ncbi:MAG: 2Fe-2S iron-sulfur cluster-binding protein, partial [Actinomycetota bacterium]|nr:2Fe-2S iron-sulfur cluster-binding protein [Actinomycetota bacterium]
MPKVIFLPAGTQVEVDAGEDILRAAAKADVHVNASCGGEGTCGKCKVKVGGQRVETGSTARLTEEEIAKGYVLACKTPVFRDLKIAIPVESELVAKGRSKIKTLTSSIDSWNAQLAALEFDPPVVKKYFALPEPSLSDSVSDMTRISRLLRRELDVDEVKIDLDTVKRVPDIVRRSRWRITVTALREADHCRVIAIEPGDTTKKYYALAVDIGTTTCAAQIIDLNARQ